MELKEYALKYLNLGLKPTCMSYLKTKYNISEKNIEKSPCHPWRRWQVSNPDINDVSNLPFEMAIGLGTVLGFNNRCIDIDNCNDENFVKEVLRLLRLPIDYEWTVKTPNGYHIHIYVENSLPFLINKLSQGILSLKPNGNYNDKFSRIEFRWANHAVLPPTKLNGKNYEFINTEFPKNKPYNVDIFHIYFIILRLCGIFSEGNGLIGKIRIENLVFEASLSSSEYYPTYSIFDANDIPIDKFLECNPSHTIRSVIDREKIIPLVDHEYEKTKKEPTFISIETTGLIKNVLDYETYPKLIKVIWNDDNYKLKKQFKNIKLDKLEELKDYDNYFEKPIELKQMMNILRSTIKDENPVVCYNSDFILSVIDVECLRINREENINENYQNPLRNGVQIFSLMEEYSNLFKCKYPTLKELYEILFKEEIPSINNTPLDNFDLLVSCYKYLCLIGSIELTSDGKKIELK